ncbi:MAG: YbjQ family protein [Desulfosarcinaceae bacterium]|jgi:uncharacterized protein YbjQ (UPF0145 family)
MSERFNVIFKGDLLPGVDPSAARKTVAQLLKVDAAKAEQLFSGQPTVLRRDVDRGTAEKIQRALKNAGAACELALSGAGEPAAPGDAPPAPPQSGAPQGGAAAPQGEVVHHYFETQDGHQMILTNIETIPGKAIVEHFGLVSGSTIRAKHIGRDFMASLKNLVGGELKGYTQLMSESRRQATERMISQARQLGANAIINVRYSTSSVAQGAAELYAYGTAVKFV